MWTKINMLLLLCSEDLQPMSTVDLGFFNYFLLLDADETK